MGTQNASGQTNLAIFNSIVHVGASPPLVGLVMRPVTVERHTYENIIETGYYTINHVHKSFVKNAHFTSATFSKYESEFDQCNLTPEYFEGIPAPFVFESKIKFGLKLIEDTLIKSNGTRFLVGEIQFISVEDQVIEADGQLDLEIAHDVCVTGLNQYSSVSKFKKYGQAEVKDLPDFKAKERPDSVVFEKESQSYNSSLLPYATNIGAPKITETGVSAWKNVSTASFNHTFQNKIETLKKTYQQLIEEYQLNEMLYQVKTGFEPIVGQVYYLYRSKNQDEQFLSLIPPSSWKKEYLGAFRLNHEKVWQRVVEKET